MNFWVPDCTTWETIKGKVKKGLTIPQYNCPDIFLGGCQRYSFLVRKKEMATSKTRGSAIGYGMCCVTYTVCTYAHIHSFMKKKKSRQKKNQSQMK